MSFPIFMTALTKVEVYAYSENIISLRGNAPIFYHLVNMTNKISS